MWSVSLGCTRVAYLEIREECATWVDLMSQNYIKGYLDSIGPLLGG